MENRPHPPLCDQCKGYHELTNIFWLNAISWGSFVDDIMMWLDLNQLFKTVSSKRILDFVKDLGLYNSL